jgi:hypothetical protein
LPVRSLADVDPLVRLLLSRVGVVCSGHGLVVPRGCRPAVRRAGNRVPGCDRPANRGIGRSDGRPTSGVRS